MHLPDWKLCQCFTYFLFLDYFSHTHFFQCCPCFRLVHTIIYLNANVCTSHHITSYHIISHHITPHHITSYHTTSHHITPHHIISHHITSHHITSHHRKECEELEADERNIEMKIIKKQEELERSEKRYKSLENVRPQFMDEVEMLWIMHFATPSMTMI